MGVTVAKQLLPLVRVGDVCHEHELPPDAEISKDEPKHTIGLLGTKLTFGSAFTVIEMSCDFSQPFTFEVTVYVVLFVG